MLKRLFAVTGAGSGLGEAVARRLAADGHRVLLLDVDEKRGAAVAAELGDASALFVKTDVADETSVRDALARGAARFDGDARLGGAVSCAGVAIAQRVYNARKDGALHDLAAFERVLRVNLVGTFNVARLAVAQMATHAADADGARGCLVHTASVAAFDGQIGQAAYAASKGGVAAMTLPLARELAALGVRVVTVAPGVFETPMMASLPAKARAQLEQMVPFPPRLGRPAEFAHLVAHIIDNPMLNGEVIRLDGAIRMP